MMADFFSRVGIGGAALLIAVFAWRLGQAAAFSYRQHKAVLDKVRREEEGLPCFPEDFTHTFHASSFPSSLGGPDVFHIRSDLERLEQLVLAISDANNALFKTQQAFEQARIKEYDFDPDSIEQAIYRSIDAIAATNGAARELTGFFREDIKTLMLERGSPMINWLQTEIERFRGELWQIKEHWDAQERAADERRRQRQRETRLAAQQEENRRQELELEQLRLQAKQRELAVREQEAQIRTRELEHEHRRLQQADRQAQIRREQARAEQAQAEAQAMAAQAETARADADRAVVEKIAADAADIPLSSYLDFLRAKFDAITREELAGDNHTRLFELYGALKEAFQRHHLLPPEQLEAIAPDVKRLDQIETLIDLYSEKIRRVKEDDTLDPEEQQLKIEYWSRIRDRDIAELEK